MTLAGAPVQYAWREGFWGIRGSSAQQVGELVAELEARDGVCTAEALVDASRDERSPLHRWFEWNDTLAAQHFRLHQARHVLRNLVLIRESAAPDSQPRALPALVAVPIVREGESVHGYMSAERALADHDLRALVLAEALTQLRGLQRRYGHLRELATVWQAIERAATEANAEDVDDDLET